MIAKPRESKYQPGARSKNWLKIKAWRTEKFTVIGYTENRRLHAVSGVLLGEKRAGGEWFYRGSVGSGFPVEDRRALLEALATAPELPNPPADGPKEAKWRGIGLHCRVMFLEETASGRLRSPVFKGWIR